jgi:signal transduction histidine kinase
VIRSNKLDLLERMADDLAHEIKNPLHSMVINLEVLRRRIARAEAAGSTDMLRYADVLATELERVNQRVELLLRMVRPGRGVEVAPLHEVLEEMRDLVAVEALRRSVELQYEPFGTGARRAVPRELGRQLILNLVLAVLDALGSGGQLHVGVDAVENEIHVRIRGEGAGAAVESDGEAGARAATAEGRLEIARQIAHDVGGEVRSVPGTDALELLFSLPAS